jgi:hypothetical protein
MLNDMIIFFGSLRRPMVGYDMKVSGEMVILLSDKFVYY